MTLKKRLPISSVCTIILDLIVRLTEVDQRSNSELRKGKKAGEEGGTKAKGGSDSPFVAQRLKYVAITPAVLHSDLGKIHGASLSG